MSKSSTPETKNITVELPIEYWFQLYEMQGVGPCRNTTLNKIARQFIIERLDKERLTQEHLGTKRLKASGGEIELKNIGINVDVISGKMPSRSRGMGAINF